MLSYDAPVSVNGQTPSAKLINMSINNNLGPNPAPKKTTVTPVTPNGTIAKINGHPSPAHHHIWLVTGPAGCGKSTVANHLATSLNLPYVEGDEVSLDMRSWATPVRLWHSRIPFQPM